MGLRVAVTGATGNVGTAVLDALAMEGSVDRVTAIARRRPDHERAGVDWVEADVAVDDLTSTFAGHDAVVHLAWLFHPTRRPMETWRANAVGSERVFEAAAAAGVGALVHASSVGAYSPGSGRVTERWPTHAFPGAAYGREKAYAERVLDTIEARHPELRVVRLRPAFIFQRRAATEQRRIFAGPFVPGSLVQPGRLPILPFPKGLSFQAVHAADVAEAYRLAVVGDVRGPFNIAAPPDLDAHVLADVLETRPVELPAGLVRGAMAAAWRVHLAPADPALLDLVLTLPLLDSTRARTELGWEPRYTSIDAVRAFLGGLDEGAGGETPPLEPDSLAGRADEIATGVGARA